MADFQDDFGYGDEEPTVVGGGYEDEYGYDEYGGYDDFAADVFEEEDYGPVGPVYVQAHTSKGLDAFAMLASLVMVVCALGLVSLNVLNQVYDVRFGGMLALPYPMGDEGQPEEALSPSLDNSRFPARYVWGQPAPHQLQVLAIGTDINGGNNHRFAILTGRSMSGVYPGMIYYLPRAADGTLAFRYLVVTGIVEEQTCRADFVEFNDEPGELKIKLTIDEYESDPDYFDAEEDMAADTGDADQIIRNTEQYNPPYVPRRRNAFLRTVVEEALDLDVRGPYPIAIPTSSGGTVEVWMRPRDPNPFWNPLVRATVTTRDLETEYNWVREEHYQEYTTGAGQPLPGIVILANVYVKLAKYDDQIILTKVNQVLADYED